MLLILILSRTAGDKLTAGPGVTHGWTAWIPSGVTPIWRWNGFCVDKTDSLAVSAGSNDQLTISNAGSGPITYVFAVAGNTG